MRWLRWLGRRVTARDGDFWSDYHGTDSWSGERVTVQGAMNLSAFWACARITAQTIATLPITVYERKSNGDRVPAPDHPLYRLLRDTPNADQTAVEFWEGRVLGLCTTGNGFAEKVSSGRTLIALNAMPADTAVDEQQDGSLRYRFVDRGKEVTLPEEKVFHVRAFGDGRSGMSPVAYARQTLGIAMATDKAAGQLFSKGMRAKGFFTFPSQLTSEQREQARKNFAERYSGSDAPGVGILEAGVAFQPVNISPHDAELILSRKFNVEEICRWLGVPPIVIGHSAEGQTMWGSGVEHIMQSWLTLGLRPYLKRIEQAISKRLLTPEEQRRFFAEFNVEGLLRADSAGRMKFYQGAIQNAIMTPNQARAKENMEQMEGGDQLLVNSTLIPLALAGQQRPSNQGSGTRAADDE
ncbi:HK97 family phage portal protein [Methylobacterium sp. PvP062]|uniref:HK97 family phage portal protein n=1 Tax=Methylobacterium radiotolerans TaxID=31998 RepID=A0ABV2NNB5_9HYPH|nr:MULTISPECIES: phage portal protein [unclassified Methylobacterium]MBP2495391.1 HK97 family phage portal protein [Methylobacterium sp. PvP105]MBP2504738.1 HK97 family phage portal protein [Methylobacterium sp. PvP109]MCX7335748.1 phage portal protein [Hyphomicrobiales bacterium]